LEGRGGRIDPIIKFQDLKCKRWDENKTPLKEKWRTMPNDGLASGLRNGDFVALTKTENFERVRASSGKFGQVGVDSSRGVQRLLTPVLSARRLRLAIHYS